MRSFANSLSKLSEGTSRFLLAAVMVLTLVTTAIPAGAEMPDPEDGGEWQLAGPSPEFLDYIEDPPEVSYGYMPPPFDLSHLDELAVQEVEAPALPSRFDWRDQGKVTSVKDQNPCGMCWAFGTTSVLESAVLMGESTTYDFSEQSVGLCLDRSWVSKYDDADDPCNAGGNVFIASEVFIRKGAVSETCNPYDTSALNCDGSCVCDSCPAVKTVDGVRLVTHDGSQIDVIKNAVYNEGPVTVGFQYESEHRYEDPTWGTIYDYYPNPDTGNHIVSIVGWDDDVPHPDPDHGGTGAWIAKNSWGTGWGNDGYFYLTYDSSNAGEVAYLQYKDSDPDEELLYWDEAGIRDAGGFGDGTAWFASVFMASADKALTHVEFWTTSSNAAYEIYVWDGRFESQLAHQTGSCQELGYYSVSLDTPISVPEGEQFTVGVKMTTPGFNYPIPVEYEEPGWVEPPIQSEVSFIRHSAADSWTDLASYDCNACLRARMAEVESAPRTWNGSVSSDWHTASNWTPSGVPTSSDDVTIPDVANDPIISTGDAQVNNLTVDAGAVLDLTNRTLTVEGTLTNDGTLKQTRGVAGGSTTNFLRITNLAGTQTKYYGVDITPSSIAGSATLTEAERFRQTAIPTARVGEDIHLLERLSKGNPKLASSLTQLLETRRREGLEEAKAFAGRHSLVLDDSRVQVVIQATGETIGELREAVEALGGEYQTHYETLLQALVPIDALGSLAERPDVRLVREPRRPIPAAPLKAGTVDSEGLVPSNASAWHTVGYTGSGVRVGVIAVGFTDYASLLGSDLPPSVNTYDWTGEGMSGSAEGTACAEIVYDMAPGATMDLHKVSTDVELGNAVDQAIDDGVDIISLSIIWLLDGPGDGTGFLADIVSDARSNGILFAAAGGNNAEHSWSGIYNDSGFDTHLWASGQDVNYFGPGDGDAWIIPEGYPIVVALHWDDWTVVNQDYDLVLYYWDGDSWEYVAESSNLQDGTAGQTPEEFISVEAPVEAPYGVVAWRYSATRDVCLRLNALHQGPDLDERVPQRSVMFPGDSPDAITVGAVDVSSPYPVEPYSSHGPTFGAGGTCLGGSIKPDITAYANVSTVSYGAEGFAGTSAATPHVAGAAALVKEAYPTYTVSQLQDYLEDNAIDRGNPGKDNLYGAGRIYLGDAPTPANNPPHQPSDPSPADGATEVSTDVDLSWTGGDPDSGDTVTYDVYFEADDSTPDTLICDDVSTPTCDPGTLDAGTDYYWYVEATDNHGASTEGDIWDFTTESDNEPPSISGLPDQEVPMNGSVDNAIDLWAYADDAKDADDELTFTISNAPAPGAGVTIDSNRHVDINPASGWTGTTDVEIQVQDTGGLTDTDDFQVTVTETNTPPTLSGLPDQEVPMNGSADDVIDLWAYANDAEDADDELTFTISNAPAPGAGVTIDSNRHVDINPASGWTGTTDVEIQVQDTGGLTDTDDFQVTVTETNTPPTLSGLPDQEVPMNGSADDVIDLWAYANDAEDADDELTFTISNAPAPGAGVTIDSNRYIDINPDTGWAGTIEVEIQVEDTGGLTDSDSFQVSVVGTNVTVSVSGNQFCAGRNTGVERCFDVEPEGEMDATVRFYFREAERNALALGDLLVFHYIDEWTEEPGPYTRGGAGDAQYVEAENVDDFSLFALDSAGGGLVYLPLVMKRWPPIPDVPVLNPISNPDGDGNYTVSWGSAYLADTYTLQEDDNVSFSSPTTRYTGSGTSWNASGKAPGTYYYRVKASNSWGDSGWSNVESVTVVPPTNPPYQPGNPTPADGATSQDLNVDLSWTGGDPDPGDTVTYDVYFESGDSTPEELVCDDVSKTSCDPGTLERAGHYYWYVEARDNHGATTTGETWDFYTVCPDFRTGQWEGAADFTVSNDRSRVLDFSLDIYCYNCFDGEVTADELPIENCRIKFAATGGGAQVSGSGTFVSDTEMDGFFSVFTSQCMCWGNWHSWWVSSSQQPSPSGDSSRANGATRQSIVVSGMWQGFIPE